MMFRLLLLINDRVYVIYHYTAISAMPPYSQVSMYRAYCLLSLQSSINMTVHQHHVIAHLE